MEEKKVKDRSTYGGGGGGRVNMDNNGGQRPRDNNGPGPRRGPGGPGGPTRGGGAMSGGTGNRPNNFNRGGPPVRTPNSTYNNRR